MEESEVAYLHEARRQHMLEETAHEFHDIQCRGADPLAVRFFVVEEDLAFVDLDDAAVGDGDAEEIGGEVFERCLGAADCLAVDDPVRFPGIVRYLREQSGFIDSVAKLRAVDAR